MLAWLLTACETLAKRAQDRVPPRLRGLVEVSHDSLHRARAGQGVHLLLPPESVLQQRFDLADKGVAATPTWLAARVEAVSPWDRDACLWDSRVEGNSLWLAILPLRLVTEAETVLTAQGARLAEVAADGFRFRRDGAQVRRWRDRLALSAGLITCGALGLGMLGIEAGLQAQDRAGVAEAALARSAARLAEGAGPAQAALALLPRKKASVALALSHLAQALPQDTYLTTLSVTAEGFEISGQTTAPEGIIPGLSADSSFANVDFAGPAAHDPDTGAYTFTIRGTLVAP